METIRRLRIEDLVEKARKFHGKLYVVLDCRDGSVVPSIVDFELEEVLSEAD